MAMAKFQVQLLTAWELQLSALGAQSQHGTSPDSAGGERNHIEELEVPEM